MIDGYIMNEKSCMMILEKEGVMIKVPREPRKTFSFKKENELMEYYILYRCLDWKLCYPRHGAQRNPRESSRLGKSRVCI
jgi:hypothetical protein